MSTLKVLLCLFLNDHVDAGKTHYFLKNDVNVMTLGTILNLSLFGLLEWKSYDLLRGRSYF